MDKSEFDKYLKERYTNQVDWYDRKAGKNQFIYTIFQWGLIILSALTPMLVTAQSKFTNAPYFEWIPIICSVLVAILASGLKTFRFQEIWIDYRMTCEHLRKEYFLYQGEIDDYETASDKERLFIDRVETIISRENNTWVLTQKKQSTNKKP